MGQISLPLVERENPETDTLAAHVPILTKMVMRNVQEMSVAHKLDQCGYRELDLCAALSTDTL